MSQNPWDQQLPLQNNQQGMAPEWPPQDPASPGSLPPDPDGFFTPAHPGMGRRQPQAQQHAGFEAPPAYQGPVGQGQASPPPPPMLDPEEEPPDDRMIYQAPSRRRGVLTYLYIGLALLIIVLVVTAAGQLFGKPEQKTAKVTISEQGSTFSGQALIVRNEAVFQQENVADVRFTAEEGAAVNRGDAICTVFSSGFSAREVERLQSYRDQIRDYQKVLLNASKTPDTQLARLDSTVMDRAQETMALVRGTQGNLLNQEILLKDAISQRQTFLKQKYIEDTKLTRLYDNENSQLQRIETWTKQFAATDNGIVSFYTDGFESVLNSATYQEYSPDAVRSMLGGTVPKGTERPKNAMDIFRLVRQYDWGALMLSDDLSWNPVVGDEYKMLIESFDSTTVNVTVESVTRAGGEMLVRLKADSVIEPILYVRSARVQLSKSVITYAVPAAAVINQDGVIGVVVQYQEGPYLVPVDVISQDATQAHVVPVTPGHLYEGLTVRLF